MPEDRIYFGKTRRLLVEQSIGEKIWDKIEAGGEYVVRKLNGNGHEEIILIEEKETLDNN